GIQQEDGTTAIYTDTFCAIYETEFLAQGGDKTLMPECPEEPVEPLSESASTKGKRAGAAAAQAYLQFRKKQAALKLPEQALLPGFYDSGEDRWVSREPGVDVSRSFNGKAFAVLSKDEGLVVIDRNGRIVVPFLYRSINTGQA